MSFYNTIRQNLITAAEEAAKKTDRSSTGESKNSYTTTSSTILTEYRDEIGYLGSKKAFSVTQDSSSTMAYFLNTMSNAGTQLVIDTYNGSSGADALNKGPRIIPVIPYRYLLADYGLLKNLKDKFSNQPVDNTGTSLLFNPGFTRGTKGQSSSVGFGDLDTYIGSAERFEINLTRGQQQALIGDSFVFWRDTSGSYQNVVARISSISIDDYQASMIVIPDSTTKDILYLSVSSRVTLKMDYKYALGDWHTGQQISWCVPVVLKYEIDKSSVSSLKWKLQDPISWTYPFLLSQYDDITPTVSSGLENKSVISGRHIYHSENNKSQGAFWPLDHGAVVDISWNDHHTTDRLEIVSARGEERDVKYSSKDSKNISKVYHLFESFSTDAYNSPSNIYVIANYPHSVINSIQIESKDDFVFIGLDVLNISKDGNIPFVQLISRQTFNSKISSKLSLIKFTNSTYPDILLSSSGKFYIHLSSATKNIGYILNLPNTLSEVAALGNSSMDIHSLKSVISNPQISLEKQLDGIPWGNAKNVWQKPDATTLYYSRTTDNVGVIRDLDKVTSRRFMLSNSSVNGDDFMCIQEVRNYSKYMSLKYYNEFKIEGRDLLLAGTDNQIQSVQSSGLASGEYFIANLKKAGDSAGDYRTGLAIEKVYRSPASFTLGSPQVEYWRDPVFGSDYWKSDGYDWDQDRGIKLQINITGCYGVWSKDNPLTIQSYNDSLKESVDPNRRGGVEVNTNRRSDFDFKYYGNKESFENSFSSWRGGYSANPTNTFKVSCTYNDRNILMGTKNIANIHPSFWSYDETGDFNCYIPITIKPPVDANGRDFTQADYVLSGVSMNVQAINKYGVLLNEKTLSFDIAPPDATGYIRSSNGYKSIGDIEFVYYRNSTKNSSTFTELHDIVSYTQAQNGEGVKTGRSLSLKGFGDSSGTYKKYASESLSRGMGIHYNYIPKLYGLKPNRTGDNINELSEVVTYCKGHRFSLANVSLYMGIGGSYGSNLLSKFGDYSDTYNYVDVDNDQVDFKATIDINHENWQLLDPRSNYSDSDIYPCISGIYIYTIGELIWPEINKYHKDIFKPVTGDNTKTYPNVEGTHGYGKSWWKTLVDGGYFPDGVDQLYATGIYFPGTASSLSSQDITLSIYKSGRYRVYLTIEDEFGQFSEFCLTNPTNYYQFPFED